VTITVHLTHEMSEGTLMTITGGSIPDRVMAPLYRSPYHWNWSGGENQFFYQQSSRDQLPRRSRVRSTAEYLRSHGYEVINDVPEPGGVEFRPMEDVEADRADRIDDYANRLEERAEKKQAKSDAYQAKADLVFKSRPMGQPFMPDHYSYNADMNRHLRALKNDEKARDLGRYASVLEVRAEIAANHNDDRYKPRAVRSKVRGLEKKLSEVNTRITKGAYLGPGQYEPYGPKSLAIFQEQHDHYAHQLAYWRPIMEEFEEQGELSTITKETVAEAAGNKTGKGAWVKNRGSWYEVVRANKTTVTVRTMLCNDGETWLKNKTSYDNITEVHGPLAAE
jgi:hypothetical protein